MLKTEQFILLLKKSSHNHHDDSEPTSHKFIEFARPFSTRYSDNASEQTEIIKLCLRKANLYYHQLDFQKASQDEFEIWLRKMMLYAAVDYFRNNFKAKYFLNIDSQELGRVIQSASNKFKLSFRQIDNVLQQLPPSNQLVITLTALYGLTVEELAQCLNITPQKAHFLLIEATSRLEVLISSPDL